MTTNFNPDLAAGLFQKKPKDETEQALERATSEGETAINTAIDSSEDTLRHMIESNESAKDQR